MELNRNFQRQLSPKKEILPPLKEPRPREGPEPKKKGENKLGEQIESK